MPFHPKLRAYTRRQLADRGIDIKVNTTIREVTEDQVLPALTRLQNRVAALESETLRAFEHGTPVMISVDGTDHELLADEVSIQRRASGALVVQEDGTRFAALDPAISPELRREGLAREVVSRVQRMRKETGLQVSDRIRLEISGPAEVRDAISVHREWIAGEVLAELLVTKDTNEVGFNAVAVELDGIAAHIALTKDC